MASYNRKRRRAMERGKDLSKLSNRSKLHGGKVYQTYGTILNRGYYFDPGSYLNPLEQKGGRNG